jgi:hypothetical protein
MIDTRLLLVAALIVGCKGSGGGASATGSASAGSAGAGAARTSAAGAAGGGSAGGGSAGGGAAGAGSAGAGSAAAGSAGGAAGPATGKPLRAALLDEAGGKPLLLALDASGQLVARSADGTFNRVLAPGPYGDAAPDDERELVWLRGDIKLDVVDLRAPGPAAAKNLATSAPKAIEKLGEHITEPPTWTMATFVNIMLDTPCMNGAGLRLDWARDGAGTTTGGESVRVVAKDWFAAQEKRAKRTVPAGFSVPGKRHKVPRRVGTCHADAKDELGKSACGTSMPFGATGLELVVVGASADRCPSKQCQLYDAKTKKFSPVPGVDAADKEARTCGPVQFDSTGRSYLVEDKVCGPDLTCSSVGRLAIGWLEASRTLDAN